MCSLAITPEIVRLLSRLCVTDAVCNTLLTQYYIVSSACSCHMQAKSSPPCLRSAYRQQKTVGVLRNSLTVGYLQSTVGYLHAAVSRPVGSPYSFPRRQGSTGRLYHHPIRQSCPSHCARPSAPLAAARRRSAPLAAARRRWLLLGAAGSCSAPPAAARRRWLLLGAAGCCLAPLAAALRRWLQSICGSTQGCGPCP